MLQLKEFFYGKKYVTLMYTILVTIFSLIIQVSLTRMFFYLSLGVLDYVVLIGVALLYLELFSREVRQEKIAIVSVVLGGVFINIVHGGVDFYRYLIMIAVHVFILIINISVDVSREDVKRHTKSMIALIGVSAVGFIDHNSNYFYMIGQLCIMFFIIYIYILRILREFAYGLRKENKKQNIMYILFILLLLIDSTQKIFIMAAEVCLGIFLFFLAEFLGILGYTVGPIITNLKINPSNIENFFKVMNDSQRNGIRSVSASKYTPFSWENILVVILQIITVVVVIFIVYKIAKVIMGTLHVDESNSGITIEREKIKKTTKIKNKKRAKQPVTVKERILYNYRDFLIKAQNKKLYKDYMTGRQIQSRVGAEVCQVQDELKVMTSIYNEVKFSSHDIDEKKLKDFNDNYDKVKKEFR